MVWQQRRETGYEQGSNPRELCRSSELCPANIQRPFQEELLRSKGLMCSWTCMTLEPLVSDPVALLVGLLHQQDSAALGKFWCLLLFLLVCLFFCCLKELLCIKL